MLHHDIIEEDGLSSSRIVYVNVTYDIIEADGLKLSSS
jgi:hypothetical protein